ncbi:MAG: DNRLRE domain-containing protein [Candidatus Marinimicrobia bacterium]|nr:DNRLRE domain-containing protein [Candidatus Neomarinimicrobiota bacterium]MCF7841171.1 DNRLRE domain-containing protein [Candidatus Neomarinimicrobiota bacterium]MCF7902060.1 DNRLRE domain-containing protein [Candidatus Neomarinimicrobiota bacterium]
MALPRKGKRTVWQRGVALVYVAIITLLILSLISIFMINMAAQQGHGSLDFLKSQQAFQLAMSGVDYMFDLARAGQLSVGTYGPYTLGTGTLKVEVEDLGANLRKITVTGDASGYERVLNYEAASKPKIFFPEYPLVDDAPSGTIPGEPSDSTLEDEGSVIDALVWENNKNTNYGTYAYLYTGKVSNKKIHSLVKLDLTFIPMGRTINSATIEMRMAGASDYNAHNIGVHRITNQWNENEVTWRHRETGVLWSSQGGDYFSTAEDIQSVTWNGNKDYVGWDVTNSVTDMYNGVYPNYGWLFKYSGNDNDYTIFSSREYYECWPGSGWWCWLQIPYPPRITVEYTGPPSPDGLQIYSPVTINGDLFVRGNVLVANGATMGDPPNDPTTIYVPVGDTVVSNEFDAYFDWSTLSPTPDLAYVEPSVLDTVDSLIGIAQAVSSTSGNKFNGSQSWSNTTLDLSDYEQSRIFVDGNVTLSGVTIPGEFLETPGIIIADGDITLQNGSGSNVTTAGDNIILVANGNIYFKEDTYFGQDHSALNPEDRPETVNMAWARSYFFYMLDGDVQITDDAVVWANCVAYRDGFLESTLYGGFYCHNELDVAYNSTYLEGAIWTGTLKNDALPAGTFNFTNIFPTVYFAGRTIQVYGGGFSEE